MAPSLKLVYFNVRGRAEVIRIALAVGGVPYEDYRLKDGEWATMKANTPFGHVPMLVVDGKEQLSESGAIARYVSKLGGIAGKSPLETAKVEMIAEAFMDTMQNAMKARFEKDESKKAEMKKQFFDETLPAFLEKVEKQLKANNGGTGFFVGDAATLADVVAFCVFDELQRAEPACLDKCSCLKGLYERVGALPKVKEWVAKRPESTM